MKWLALLCGLLVLVVLWLAWRRPPGPPSEPPTYFAFASEPLPERQVREIVGRYGSNVLIGVDANSEHAQTLSAARQARARLHIYLEGPGGPTGDAWTPDESERIRQAAQSVGLSGADWQRRWEEGGWKTYTFEQLRRYREQGFESAEIDNLYRVAPDLLGFYQEYAGWWERGLVPRAMLKNVEEEPMRALVEAVRAGRLPQGMFADFAIYETSAGDPARFSELAAQLGIQTLISQDTYDYRVSGAYGLKTRTGR